MVLPDSFGRSLPPAGSRQDLLHDRFIHQLQVGQQDMTVRVVPDDRHIRTDIAVHQVVGIGLIPNNALPWELQRPVHTALSQNIDDIVFAAGMTHL